MGRKPTEFSDSDDYHLIKINLHMIKHNVAKSHLSNLFYDATAKRVSKQTLENRLAFLHSSNSDGQTDINNNTIQGKIINLLLVYWYSIITNKFINFYVYS
jgi:hypothetical protein